MNAVRIRIGECIISNPTIKLEKNTSYPIIDIDKITVGNKIVTNSKEIIYTGQSGAKFENGDTIMARITPCLENGKFAQVKIADKGIGSTELFVFRGKEGVTDNDFVYYLFKQQFIRDLAANSMTGASGRQRADLKFIKKIEIDLPSLPVQRRIAEVLSAYDALIENNNKRIRLLERMAENLYREWFVRFRFPGHETTPIIDGLPKGWKRDKFMNYAKVKRGGSPRPIQDFISDVGYKWLKISDATATESPFIFSIAESIKEEGLNKTVFRKKGTLVLSNSATPGISKILCLDTCIHDGWLYFEDSYFSNEFLNLLFKTERQNILKLGNGAVFTNLKTDILKNYIITVPSKLILDKFQEIVAKLYSSIKSLMEQNAILAQQRDALLPRLMSGKLEVKTETV